MILFFYFLLFLKTISSENILAIFPTPSYSHQIVFKVLIKDLAARGHAIVVLAPFLGHYNNSNVTEIDMTTSDLLKEMKLNWNDFQSMSSEMAVANANYWKVENHKAKLKIGAVRDLIINATNHKFDLMILEYFNHLTYMAFAELFDCPVVGISSLDPYIYVHEEQGNAANPLTEPDFYLPYLHGKLSIFERIRSLIFYINLKLYRQPQQEAKYAKIIQENFPNNKESLSELKERLQLLLINSSPVLKSRALAPNVIPLGFMHIEAPKELPEGPLKSFLDNSKLGVIFMSFGSFVKSENLDQKVIKIFLDTFRTLNYDVIWKFENENLPNKSKNVFIAKWLPQADLLAHHKVKIFITQCGLQSMEEAIDRLLPMIAVPFILDQMLNARIVESKKIGVHLELSEISVESLKTAIIEVLKPVYKENIAKIRNLVYDMPISSREKAVWWIEYVIRNKNLSELKYPVRLVPFYKKCGLDIAFIILICLFVIWKAFKFSIYIFVKIIKLKIE